jgi:radical SAM protein with 4Fe4S-binding SPASM domain
VSRKTLNLQLEPTTRCNANCLFCPRKEIVAAGIRHVEDMSLAVVKKVAEDLHTLQASGFSLIISFCGLGEPLLYKNLVPAIRTLRDVLGTGIFIRVATNVLCLQGELADALRVGDVDELGCSMSVPTEALYRKYKPGVSFVRVRDNLVAFLQKKGGGLPAVRIKFNLFDDVLPALSKAEAYWKQFLNANDEIVLEGLVTWMGRLDGNSFIQAERQLARPCHYFAQAPRIHRLAINCDGGIFACRLAVAELVDSTLWLGNVQNQSIQASLHHEKWERIRQLHINGSRPVPCKTCTVYTTPEMH